MPCLVRVRKARPVFNFTSSESKGMSTTTMYEVPEIGPVRRIAEFFNSWGSAYRVWEPLIKSYLLEKLMSETAEHYSQDVPNIPSSMLADVAMGRFFTSGNMQRLWDLADDPKLPRWERLALAFTFDRVICEANRKLELAAALRHFDRMHPTEGVSHLSAIADYLEEWRAEGLVGFCWRQTSVSEDLWWVYDGPETNEYDEGRPYDHSRDYDPDRICLLFERYDK